MNPSLLLDMVAETAPDRRAVGELTYGELLARARSVAGGLGAYGATHLGYVDEYCETVPVLFYAAQLAGLPFVPLNYRLSDADLRAALVRLAPAVVVAGPRQRARCAGIDGITVLAPEELPSGEATETPGEVSVLLFTSGTSGQPKAAVLRPQHLTSYVLSTVDFLSAGEDEAQLVSVPPYHIAGISTIMTSLFAGRRIVVLPSFTPDGWVDTVTAEQVTHAMVVPTMLGRILDVLAARGASLPALRHLSYGGGRMPAPVVERALRLLPHVNLVNAYGLTETSSTIAVLGPKDHRDAIASADPAVRARLGSVGRALPGVEIEIRDAEGRTLGPGEAGEIYVRGEQVSGEYLSHRAIDEEGWFPTRDRGHLDAEGFLFLDGRADDVIVRGGENLSPGEIEDVLLGHEQVADAMVLGLPDVEWGEVPVAAVVPAGPVGPEFAEQLREYVRARLRSAKTPARIVLRDALPHTETGKALRRVLRAELTETAGLGAPMRITPDADAENLRSVVRSFLDRHCPADAAGQALWQPAVWNRFATELGATGLDVPEAAGGAGASFREVAIVAGELGRGLASLPWFGTAVLAVGALLPAHGPERDKLLARFAGGAATGTLAEQDDTEPTRADRDGRLTGIKRLVLDGATADVLLVTAATDDGLGLYAVDGDALGVTRTPLPAMDFTRPLATIELRAAPARLISEDAAPLLAAVHTRAVAALAAEQTGGAAAAMDAAVGYAADRIQFGRPIATFQAIKHRCADMAVRVEAARSASLWAAAAIADRSPDAELAAATAGLVCGESYTWVAAENVQVHGGIGFTWEHTAHRHVRRAATSAVLFGAAADHREALLAGLDSDGGTR